jgi:hypothetical protein
MSTTKGRIGEWFDRGVAAGATHLIVVSDTFEHDEYPVYVEPGEDALKVATERYGYDPRQPFAGKEMQVVMEVYDLRKDKASQLAQRRAFNF